MYRFGPESMNKLKKIHPMLVKVMTEAIKTSPFDFTITCGVRTAVQQQALYEKGRTKPGEIVTNADGMKKKSNHQMKDDGYAYAVDLYPYIDGSIRREYVEYKYEVNAIAAHILKTAEKMGINIIWGGNWQTPFDPPHFELKNKESD